MLIIEALAGGRGQRTCKGVEAVKVENRIFLDLPSLDRFEPYFTRAIDAQFLQPRFLEVPLERLDVLLYPMQAILFEAESLEIAIRRARVGISRNTSFQLRSHYHY
jgi:hypothetical protein